MASVCLLTRVSVAIVAAGHRDYFARGDILTITAHGLLVELGHTDLLKPAEHQCPRAACTTRSH